jgi:hypothetical protein
MIADAQTVAEKWTRNTQNAAQDYAAGVANTDKDPTNLAIQAIPRMRQNVIEAIDSGRVANGLRRVGKTGWQQAVAAKGVANFQSGVAAAQSKVAQAFGPLLAFEQTLQSRIEQMPNVTDLDRENRALEWMRGMRSYVRPA